VLEQVAAGHIVDVDLTQSPELPARLKEIELVGAGGKHRTDSTSVVRAVRDRRGESMINQAHYRRATPKPNSSKCKKEPISGGGGLKLFVVGVLTSPDVGTSIFFGMSMSALCGVNMTALF
jgi:hypothetical protein